MYLFFCQYLILASETFDRLMTEASRGLVKRHVVAINEYFGKISDDCLLALAVNPVLATDGCVEILLIIGLPASNGFQERIFSGCTHHDDSLCQRVGDEHFEESVLLSANDSFGTLNTLSVGEI